MAMCAFCRYFFDSMRCGICGRLARYLPSGTGAFADSGNSHYTVPAIMKKSRKITPPAFRALKTAHVLISKRFPRTSIHPISSSQLRVLPHFHLCPIYLVVFKGVYSCDGRTHLEGGFTLRCLQRLSLPGLATRL